MKKEIIDLLSYVKTSEHRKKVLSVIDDDILLSSEISKKTDISPAHTSRALRGLQDNKLVKCLNEEKVRGRLFVTTDLGKKILKYVK
ncbi:MAG: MarR family transcriptional regulator [Methanobrevibacter sp.]|nr:MarR family transcriptional regulator [Methanobrevibacter sp.]